MAYDQALKTASLEWSASVLVCSYKSHFHLRRLVVYLRAVYTRMVGSIATLSSLTGILVFSSACIRRRVFVAGAETKV